MLRPATTRLLVIMGSGETTPTMIKPHRRIFDTLPVDAVAVVLDTPYGFQLNADQISARTVGYFAQSVGREVDVVSWRRPPPPGLERERALTALRAAGWIFAGPGSPTYALAQWRDPELIGVLTQAEVLVFASAAALTLGSHAIPVYEIYKAGADPHWLPGLDLFAQLTGVHAVIIPHYDNAEGGHHDTRHCYLGEPRLAQLEHELPESTVIVGVDEHTALVCDLVAMTATVVGNGNLTLRRMGHSEVFPTGSTLPLPFPESPLPGRTGARSARSAVDDAPLNGQADRDGQSVPGGDGPAPLGPGAGTGRDGRVAMSLRTAAERLEVTFATALGGRDLDGCVTALLELEQAISDWTADTLSSDENSYARGLLRSMVVRLAGLAAACLHDPAELARPYVVALLALRARARELGDWSAADQVRDALAGAGVAVRDTPDGPNWSLTG